jgi:hypothetical protein
MIYSTEKYDLTVYVKEDAEGKLYIHAITSCVVTNNESNEEVAGDKVDPTPGGNHVDYFYSQMIFSNDYLKNNGGEEPEDPGKIDDYTVLAISKNVKGDFADKTKYFEFKVKVSNPSTVKTTTDTYIAYVLEKDKDGNIFVATSAANTAEPIQTDTHSQKYILFTTDKELTINLKHGQWLAFIDLPVGAKFETTETGADKYLASYRLTLDGKETGPISALNMGDSLGLGGSKSIGEASNRADFLNEFKEISITGVFVDNLPYFSMIAIALFALVGFVAIKSRRREAEVEA